ncbi:MAG: DUF1501 domain-containing protein [Saprospiraceae bacterium]|nr:DUF1501 domain-containing protein [Saprospiraceae bacterium]
MTKLIKDISRRRFINHASAATFGLTTASSSLFRLNTLKAAARNNFDAGDDYKALVCLFQAGGNDSFNMLMPRSGELYNTYQGIRTNLAIDAEEMLAIDATPSGQDFGIHSRMQGVQQLFNSGKLSFIANVGTLVTPVDKAQYENKSVPLPLGLFSHSDQIAQWQTAQPNVRASHGWGGRLAEMFQAMNSSADISMNITLSGTNVFQFGDNVVEYSVGPSGEGYGIRGYQGKSNLDQARTRLIDAVLQHSYSDRYQKTYADIIKNSIEAQESFQTSIEEVADFQTEFSNSRLSRSFEMIARIIAAREELGFKRQIFFVQIGGWDHHDRLLQRHAGMLGDVSSALTSFAGALEELNVFDCVTTFSMSEFGRTLTSNGDGTDHAWGGHVMAMGGMVNGGQVFGNFPDLGIGSALDIGRGRIIPTLSNDEYFAELALWFGVAPSELPTILPNVGNFYSSGSAAPIGFLKY